MVQANIYVETAAQLQAAIDAIGAGAGVIQMGSGIFTLAATIDVDGGGSYVIQGMGDKTVVDCGGDRDAFNITVAESCVLRDFKIDATNLMSDREIIYALEGSDNPVLINNITIIGNGTNGYGIEIAQDNVIITNCNIEAVKYGIRMGTANNKALISRNNITNCQLYGMYFDTASYSTISDNICTSNYVGIRTKGAYNIISGNNCYGNTLYGIELETCTDSSITGNNCNANNPDTASDGGGIWIDSNSDNNTISGNTCNDNANIGVGTGYGIYIGNATCDNNKVQDNTLIGNNICILDIGTDTDIIYYPTTGAEIQEAIDSIDTKSGVIHLGAATYTLTTQININQAGSYIIEGEGDKTVIDCAGDRTAFWISSATSVVLRDFKIDANNLTSNEKIIIACFDAGNPIININNITIDGDGTNGIGVYAAYDNINITKCNVTDLYYGIEVRTEGTSQNKVKVIDNNISGCAQHGIFLRGRTLGGTEGIHVSGNNCYDNTLNGIYCEYINSSSIIGNICNANNPDTAADGGGIWLNTTCDYNTISGNTCNLNVNVNVGGDAYGINIANANCDDNTVMGNTALNNDTEYQDLGTNTFDSTQTNGDPLNNFVVGAF